MKKLILVLILFTPIAFCDYYADIDLIVNDNGFVEISGINNHPLLISSTNYTSKNGNLWTLDLNINETFSDYVYEIYLPKNAAIKNLSTPKTMSITNENNVLLILGIGHNETFKLIISYIIKQEKNNYFYLILLETIILIGVIVYFVLYFKKNKIRINYSLLSKRQCKIMKIIENKKRVTQKYLEELNLMPKSSLSRNIESLNKKGLIIKNKKGINNILSIKSQFVPVNSGK
jgi:uncharacterized membrane protein